MRGFRVLLTVVLVSSLCGGALYCARSPRQSSIQVRGSLSTTDVDRITRLVRNKVLHEFVGPSWPRPVRRVLSAWRYWEHHPIDRIDVMDHNTVQVIFARRNFGEILAGQCDSNIVGYKVFKGKNGWEVGPMLVTLL
jgi:hypothetical protein